jgi:adenylate cyclase
MTDVEPFYERERRFLVADPDIVSGTAWTMITQAYLFAQDGYAVRIRLKEFPDESGRMAQRSALMGVKGPRRQHDREEYEFPLDYYIASEIVKRSRAVVIKRRHAVIHNDLTWEVDEFHGRNYGLMIAELELADDLSDALPEVDLESITVPSWVGREIIDDPRFDNENLAVTPINEWPNEDWKC